MKGTILLNGRPVTVTLSRKRVKNGNLRVRADGTPGVSAPLPCIEYMVWHEMVCYRDV